MTQRILYIVAIVASISPIAAHADTAFTYQGELSENGGLADGPFNMDFALWDAAHGGHHDVGMIAEEVGAVLPEIVVYEENGVDAQGMDYSKLTPLLVEAVNALRAKMDAELDALREENAVLRARIERLEAAIDDTALAVDR